MAGTVQALLVRVSEQRSAQPALPMVPLAPGSGLALVPLTDDLLATLPPVEADSTGADPMGSEASTDPAARLPGGETDAKAGGPGSGAGVETVAGFYDLTPAIAEWARVLSRSGTVAYLHTEFFGGGGFHAAVAWRNGAVAWGPSFTATSAGEAEDHYTVPADRHDMAVNALLRWLGVEAGENVDEYAAAGLNRRRWTEEWAPSKPPFLLDVDGTLIDSRTVVEEAWREVAAEFGADAEAILASCHGLRDEDVVAEFFKPEDHAAAVARIAEVEQGRSAEVVALPGAAEFLRGLPANAWAAVTSGSRRLMTERLRGAGLRVPHVFVTADDVEHGKPDPEGYLSAAERLGVDITGCVVVEDSPTGVAAGKAAGAFVIGVAADPADLPEADVVVTSLDEIGAVTPPWRA